MELIENKKIRKFVFKCLNDLLSDKTVCPYGKDFWIIGLEERNWYIHYDSNGKLHYNSKYFDDFFHMFSLEQKKYHKAIQAYEILILKYPEKSSLFADQIKALKKLQEKNKNS